MQHTSILSLSKHWYFQKTSQNLDSKNFFLRKNSPIRNSLVAFLTILGRGELGVGEEYQFRWCRD